MSLYGNKVTKYGVWLDRDQVRRWEQKTEGSIYGWSKPCDESEDYIGTPAPTLGMSYNRRLRDEKRVPNSSTGKSRKEIFECEKKEMREYTLLPSNAISRNCENTDVIASRTGKRKQDDWNMFGGIVYGRR
jgi:hypothetical protein